MLHLYMVAFSNPGGYHGDEWIELYWAEDPDHARDQAEDANVSSEILCIAMVPDDYVNLAVANQ